MKKNNKGYMLIEIILAAVIAFGIAYYLLNLTFKFINKNTDIYQSINYLSDKTAVTKNIMNDLEKSNISDIDVGTDENNENIRYVQFTAITDSGNSVKRIVINGDEKTIEYGNYTSDAGFNKNDDSYYYKKLNQDLAIGSPIIETSSEANTISIVIPLTSNYDDQDYSIKLLISNYSSSPNYSSCIIDVSDGTSNNNSSNGWYGWGMWNNGTDDSNGNYDYSSWNQYYNNYYSGFYTSNFWQQNATDTGSTDDNCKTEYSLINGNGMTYVVRFKYNGTSKAVNIFGDNFNNGNFSGIYTDSDGCLHNSWDSGKIFKLQSGTWYTFVSVFTYKFTTGQNGYSFSSKFTLYLYNESKDKCIDEEGEEKPCSSSIEYVWSTSNNSLSSRSFIVNTNLDSASDDNDGSAETSTDKGIEVSDAIFYWKAIDETLINKYFGYTDVTNASLDGINITSQDAINDGMQQRLIFHWRNYNNAS